MNESKICHRFVTIAMLCACALAQEKTADDWLEEGRSLMLSGFKSFDPAANAFNEATKLEPETPMPGWTLHQVLSYLNQKNESLEAFRRLSI